MDTVTRFHIDHGYIVKVEGLDSVPGCSAAFPANVFMNYPSVHKTYMIYTNPYVIELFVKPLDQPIISRVVEATISNIRLLVIQDIFLTAHKLGMSKELIVTESGKTLFQMLEIPMTEKEKKLETQLCVSFRKLLAGDVAILSDVEGYAQVLSCFENGGL